MSDPTGLTNTSRDPRLPRRREPSRSAEDGLFSPHDAASDRSAVGSPRTSDLLRLQQAVGNQAVQRLLNSTARFTALGIRGRGLIAPTIQLAPATGWTGAAPGTPNAAETTVSTKSGKVRRIPLDGLPNNGRAIVVVPPAAVATPTPTSVDVLLHFHGHNAGYQGKDLDSVRDNALDDIEGQVAASGRPMVGVLPQGTSQSEFGGAKGSMAFDSDAFLAAVFGQLGSLAIWPDKAPDKGRVIMSGHSGGGLPISEMMKPAGQSRMPSGLSEVALFDAINGPQELAAVKAWVERQLDADYVVLLDRARWFPWDPGKGIEAQKDFVSSGMRFRAYYEPKPMYDYKSRHVALQKAIADMFAARAVGMTAAVLDLWTKNYQVIEQTDAKDHDSLVGTGILQDAIGQLPAVPAPTPSMATPSVPAPSPSAGPVVAPMAIQRVVQRTRMVAQRQVLDMRSQHHLGAVASPSTDDNTKAEAQMALKWLLDLWAIDTGTFASTIQSWAKYQPDDQIIGADLQPLVAAIAKSEQASLANPVSNNFLGLNLPVNQSVGDGGTNAAGDLTAVQDALSLHGFLSSKTMPDTLAAIKRFKKAVAQGTFGLNPMRPDERVDQRDAFAARTFSAAGNPIPDVIVADEQPVPVRGVPAPPPVKRSVPKEFSIFLPGGITPDRNQVHVFFTPFTASNPGGAAGFVAQQGLRAQSDASAWILIGVPSLVEADKPNFVTISTDEIKTCLAAAGRSRTQIDAIRLSAHSRGHRGLENTIGLSAGSSPSISLGLVEQVNVFDASYKDLGRALTAHRKDLTAMADPTRPGQFKSGAVKLYDVTVGNISGLPGIQLDVRGIRALSYARLVQEGIARGDITSGALGALDPDVRDATNRILAKLPKRGDFSSKQPPPSGKFTVQVFMAANQSDLLKIDDPTKGLKTFITGANLDWGMQFSTDIDAHHWFVAELAHEAVE